MKKQLHHKKCLLALVFALAFGVGTLSAQEAPQHSFSVSATQQVYFAPGNLQYQASTNTWRFAINPWDYVGEANANISQNYGGWIDLFGWGTSGYNHGATCYQPWSISSSPNDYLAYGYRDYHLYDRSGQADWGYNAISNGGNTENQWFTLSSSEWNYVFKTRTTTSGVRFAKAIVNEVNGVILLPDDWDASYCTLSNTNTSNASYSTNTISETEWAVIEQHGAVFLPAAGYRYGSSVKNVGDGGEYWSSSGDYYVNYPQNVIAYFLLFNNEELKLSSNGRYPGLSVRLVRNVENTTFGINATPNKIENGEVSGAGAYEEGEVCTLMATPSAGYEFSCWTENGLVVSTEVTYSFVVVCERNLVANFTAEGIIVFADDSVKSLCVAHWDANADGELSYAEAAAVTSIVEEFKNNNTIQSFNELPYFVNLRVIGERAFYGCTSLSQITIPENVFVVGDQAFWNCPALQTVYFNAINCTSMHSGSNSVFSANTSGGASAITRVVFGNNVIRIPDYAFKGSQDIYQRLVIPASVIEIGKEAFSGCSGLALMTIQGNALQNIGENAFYNCSSIRSELVLPNSLTTLGHGAFNGCSSIPTLVLGANLISIGNNAFNNCSSIGELVIPNSVTSIGNSAFSNCNGVTNLILGNGVTSIGSDAFLDCTSLSAVYFTGNIGQWCGIVFSTPNSNPLRYGHNLYINDTLLTALSLPNDLIAIHNYTFYNCSSITGELLIPETVTSIGKSAFYGCSGITGELVIPDAVTSIDDYAFYNCSGITGELVIPDAVTSIGSFAFQNCSGLNALTIGESVATIGNSSFAGCPSLETVHFNASSCTQYSSAFGSPTPIVNLTIGNNVKRIPEYAFRNSSNMVGNLLLPDALTYIGKYAFEGCSGLTGNLSIPNSVTAFGESAFAGCTGFTGILIFGKMVNSVGENAFKNCSGFTTVISENPTPPSANNNSFSGMNLSIPVYVPFNTVSTYQSALGWSQFTNYKEQCVFDAIGMQNENWSDLSNWYAGELPNETDVVCVNSNCHLNMDAAVRHLYVFNINDTFTIDNGAMFTVTNGIGTMEPSQLVIAEGGQLINTSGAFNGTVQKRIAGYGASTEGWFTIAAPLMDGMDVSSIAFGDYDLFAYDEPTHYWLNQKIAENSINFLKPGQGYLYANQVETTLNFAGKLNTSNTEISIPVTYEGTPLEGYTLVGNPYTNNISISDVQLNGTPMTTYYKINGGGSLVAYTDVTPIKPGEGFLVMAPEGGTLTFVPSLGQRHDNDETMMRDDEEPTGSFRLPAHADLIDVDAYSGEVQYVGIAAVANDPEFGTVEGAGNYAVGSTCTLTAVPAESYAFVNWTCNGVTVSTESSYSFTVMGSNSFTANFVQTIFTQTSSLSSGWNWWSTYLDQNESDGLTMLENALGDHGLRIVSHKNGYVEPYEASGVITWYGTLSEITNEQMYKVMTNASCEAPIMGPIASPEAHPITINNGWNWIGYPSNQSMTVSEALAGFEAEEDDIIKSRNNGYASYYGGSWYGTLESLTPSSGYMFKSNSSTPKTLVFQQGRGQNVEIVEQSHPSETSTKRFKDNMTITAVVELDGLELRSTDYELAAFVGEECRGSVSLMYVEPIDRYVAFLTVLGEEAEPVNFVLVDGENQLLSNNTVVFEADAAIGTLRDPMTISFGNLNVDENGQGMTKVFPNPVKQELFVEGAGMKRVEVFNVMGQLVVGTDVEGQSMRIDMSGCANGIYLVRVMTENGMITHHIVKE